MIRFRRMKFSAAVLLLLALAACNSNNEAKPAATAANATNAEAQNLLIYTGRDKGEVDSIVALFQEKFPKYKGKVQTVILSAQASLERLRAEKSNPQAGFLWGGTQ